MIELTRLPGYDVNGNPRYVCHFLNLLTEAEKNAGPTHYPGARVAIPSQYYIAIQRAHKIGGRKYHTKRFGGGIVFTDYENEIRRNIERVVKEAEQEA